MPGDSVSSNASSTNLEKESKTLITRRGNIKARITKFKTFTNAFEASQLQQLVVRLDKIKQTWEEFDEVQSRIELLDLDTDSDERDNFEESYYDAVAIAESIIKSLNTTTQTSTLPPSFKPADARGPEVKLPVLTLPSFSGSFEDWPIFHELYLAVIHNNKTLDNIHKFQYLKSSLKGDALQMVESLQLSDENYNIAWSLITDRYQNPNLIIMKHVNDLFNVPKIDRPSASSLSSLLNEAQKHVRALKSLGQPTDSWNVLLVHLICSKLDSTTHKEWQAESVNKFQSKTNLPTFDNLIVFIQNKIHILEMVKSTVVDKPPSQSAPNKYTAFNRQNINKSYTPGNQQRGSQGLAASVTNQPQSHTVVRQCSICSDKQHCFYNCPEFLPLTVEERIKKAKVLKLCFNCLLRGHPSELCRSSKCKRCGSHHNSLLHQEPTKSFTPNRNQPKSRGNSEFMQSKPQQPTKQSNSSSDSQTNTQTSQLVISSPACYESSLQTRSTTLLSTALVDIVDKNGCRVTARALLDCGSQTSFISESLCQILRLPRCKTSLPISGISGASAYSSGFVKTVLLSRYCDYSVEIELFILPKITAPTPSSPLNCKNIQIPSQYVLADPGFHIPSKIDILIGADIFWNLIRNKEVTLDKSCIKLRETKLGWLITGKTITQTPVNSHSVPVKVFLTTLDSLDIQLRKFWELEDVGHKQELTADDKYCEGHYTETTVRNTDGRYVVAMPLRQDPSVLGDSLSTATTRFYALERRLQHNKSLHHDYCSFMKDYHELGHMVKLTQEELNALPKHSYFIPHHPVFKGSSTTTKVRVVFDASSKSSSGLSLNDILYSGPVVQDELLAIVLRFRLHNFVLCADIEKMFRQIEMNADQQFLLLILWRESPDKPLEVYRLNTVTYGTACASFLASRSLLQLAEDERESFPLASAVANDYYMDDLLTGRSTIQEAKQLRDELRTLMKKGGFNLRKWNSNAEELLTDLPPTDRANPNPFIIDQDTKYKTLGLQWDPRTDSFQFFVNSDTSNPAGTITKRSVLSTISKLFDPLGLLGPAIVKAKIFIQRLWVRSLEWDQELSQELSAQWSELLKALQGINNLNIPRQLTSKNHILDMQIHGFSDASELAYGACVYLRSVDSHGVITVNLVMSKSRVAPIKSISLPRLELCGALLLAETVTYLEQALSIKAKTFLWTDSKIVLAWLASAPTKWTTFVRNRVAKIQDMYSFQMWRHVQGCENPADLVSRGIHADKIKDTSLWWFGPPWLKDKVELWINKPKIELENIDIIESREQNTTLLSTTQINPISELIVRLSSHAKIVRVIAHCIRFITNSKIKYKELRCTSPLTVPELTKANHYILRVVQHSVFASEIKELRAGRPVAKNSKLVSLAPFLDEFQLVRVGGRLENSELSYSAKHQIVLPSTDRISLLIASEEHKRLLHAGPQMLLCSLRQQYWPINGRSLARKTVHACMRCFRANPKFINQQMGQLPMPRVTQSRPFTVTGVDYCGPFYTKISPLRKASPVKGYIAVFICFSTKALHIELVENMTTQSFLEALSRFISRRGKPSKIYSDNGTNFVGAQKELDIKYLASSKEREDLQNNLTRQGIDWSFLPPGAPHQGGLWERGVSQIKYYLKRTLKNTHLTYTQMITLLTQIEAILNSRPICPISSDPSDLEALTPSHFLIGEPLTSIPQPDFTSQNCNRLLKWQQTQRFVQDIWSRWSQQYLLELQTRAKWHNKEPNIKLGTLVLIKEESPPLSWKTARVVELHPGADSLVRVVTLRTATGILKRPITKICPLPLQDENLHDSDPS